jgi:hypothetical protein
MKNSGTWKAVAAAFCLATLAFPAAAMTLTVDAEGVTVGDLTAGARVILFGVGREPRRYQSAVRRWTEVLADSDRDGSVRFSSAVTSKSIWIAVDLETGESVADTGPGYPRREVTAGFGLKRNNAGQLSKLENARGIAELLIVRPGRGAWRLSAAKNESVDDARDNPALLRLDASAFRAVEGVPSDDLRHLRRGDVLAMIDPRVMEFYVVPVSED